MPRVTVEYYGRLTAAMGRHSEVLDLSGIRNVSDLIVYIENNNPKSSAFENCACAVNAQLCSPDTPLQDGDTLALLPPVSGG